MADEMNSLDAIKHEWRHNWRAGLAAFLAIGTSFGALNSVSSLFVLPLQQAFGWSRGEVAIAQSTTLIAALCSPLLGRIVDHFGVRWIMLIGMVLTATTYLGLASMDGTLPLYYALYGIAAVTGLTASGLTCSRVISEHFIRSRGFSLAVARSGLALAGAMLPALIFAIISRYGWRAGYVAEAVLVFGLALPCVYLWIVDKDRSDHGASGIVHFPLRWGKLFSDRRIWLLCIGAGLGYAPATAIMSQLQPLLVSKGIIGSQAATLIGIAGIASLVGALFTGMLVDRVWAPAVAFIFTCGSAVGTCLMQQSPVLDPWTATAAILLIGLGLGAEIDVVAFMVARYFGVRSFSSVYGLSVFSVAAFGAAGAALLGLSFDRFGNYDVALMVITGSFLASGGLYLLLGRYPDP